MPILAFSLIELIVGLIVLVVIVAFVVYLGRNIARKGRERALERIVKVGCTDARSGEQEILLTELEQGVIDVLTQGFTLESNKVKLVWRKTSEGVCKYKIVAPGKDSSGAAGTKETQEFELKHCPV